MLFGEIIDGETPQGGRVKLNRRGEIVREEWFASENIRKEIRLFPDEFVVMPNHIHGIVWIVENHFSNTNDGLNGNVGANGTLRASSTVRPYGTNHIFI